MTKIKIASFNTWNCRFSRRNSFSIANVFSSFVKKENIDVVGVQELTFKYCCNVKKLLPNFSFYGSYRFGNFILKRFPFNENNNIITNHKVFYQKTYLMPFLPVNFKELKQSVNIKRWSLLPRITTVVVLEIGDKKVCVINTHLDYKINSIKQRQLDFLFKLIDKKVKSYPIVLMGDFNLSITDDIFNNFVLKLDNIGIKRVSINDRTWNRKKTLDHIFIPNDWDILRYSVMDDKSMEDISDHRMILVECETI